MKSEVAHFFWHGEISSFEIGCIKSFINNGFDVKVWSYTGISIPGAESCDASQMLSSDLLYKIDHHFNERTKEHSSLAAFSDLMRYKILSEFGGWWFDADCYCLKLASEYSKLRQDKLCIVGLEDKKRIAANGVIYFDKAIAKIFYETALNILEKQQYKLSYWGQLGPKLISQELLNLNLHNSFCPIYYFYAISNDSYNLFIDPTKNKTAKSIIKDSYLTHIWTSKWKLHGIDKNNLPSGSLIHEMISNNYTNNNEQNVYIIDSSINHINRVNDIIHLYKTVLGRSADFDGLINYVNSNMSLYNIQVTFWQSEEFRNKFNHLNPVEQQELNNTIPIYIINLDRREDRKDSITLKLDNLGIKNYNIVSAVDGQTISDNVLIDEYDSVKAKQINRELTRSEVACALSHIKIAKHIIENDIQYAIILEDDVDLTIQFKQFLEKFNINENYNFDFLILGAFSSNQFFNGKVKTTPYASHIVEKESIVYLNDFDYSIGNTTIHTAQYPSMYLDFVHGASGYIMSLNGAKKLLELNNPVIVEADNVWNCFKEECSTYITNPILIYRQGVDSDLNQDRSHIAQQWDAYSATFKQKKFHNDFGT